MLVLSYALFSPVWQEGPDYTSLLSTLGWLVGPAGVAAWAMIVSDAFRNWKAEGKFVDFSPMGLQATVIAATLVVPVLAYAVLNLIPADVLLSLEPYYGFVASLFLGLIGQKVWFQIKDPA